ncbi:MAG: ABC transporter permease, partial [Mesorhizobium sp.]
RQDTFVIYEPLLLLALAYMVLTGLIVWIFSRLEAHIPVRVG